MTNGRFDRLFGGPPRAPDELLEQRHMDLAASVQAVTEEVDRAHGSQPGRGNRPAQSFAWLAASRSIVSPTARYCATE